MTIIDYLSLNNDFPDSKNKWTNNFTDTKMYAFWYVNDGIKALEFKHMTTDDRKIFFFNV